MTMTGKFFSRDGSNVIPVNPRVRTCKGTIRIREMIKHPLPAAPIPICKKHGYRMLINFIYMIFCFLFNNMDQEQQRNDIRNGHECIGDIGKSPHDWQR